MKANTVITLWLFSAFFSACISKNPFGNALSYRTEIRIDSIGQLEAVIDITFHIPSTHDLSGKKWKLYFNSYKNPKIDREKASMFTVVPLNGDLNYIEPTADFHMDGNKLTIPIRQSRLRNISDFPTGFYLVYNDEPGHGYAFTNENPLYDHLVYPENVLAKEIYENNERLAQPLALASGDGLLPSPKAVSANGQSYVLANDLVIITDHPFTAQATHLAEELKKHTQLAIRVINDPTKSGIKLKFWNLEEEAYQLRIGNSGVEISAGTASGMFYGIQTLKKLILDHYQDGQCILPGLEIDDSPRFPHRSLMLDVARNFLPKEKLLQVLDMMAANKINILHFHFNDDEGWRIAIPGLPELTTYGGRRGHTETGAHLPPSHGSGPDTACTSGSGFYSRKDFVDILTYAKERFITVIPELETPGHARAAIQSMKHRYHTYAKSNVKKATEYLLSDTVDTSTYRTVQGWTDDAINPAMESTYRFLEKVVTELALMYQDAGTELQTVHMGGDEVPAGVWEGSSAVRHFLDENASLKTVDDLWEYFYGRVGSILAKKDIRMHGWEEIGMRRVGNKGRKKMEIVPAIRKNGYLLDVWNNVYGTGAEDLAYRLANQGFDVVLSNVTHMYLDLASTRSFYEPGMYWGGYVNPEKLFSFVPENYYRTFWRDDRDQPIDTALLIHKVRLTAEGKQHIGGLQCALWSETIIHQENFDYMLYPKLISFAERAWAPQPDWAKTDTKTFEREYHRAFHRFNTILWQTELPRLDRYWNDVQYRIPAPGIKIVNGDVYVNTESDALEVRYTVNGAPPTLSDTIANGALKEKGVYRFRAFHKGTGRSSRMIVIENR